MVERYTLKYDPFEDFSELLPDVGGSWVRHSDYAALQAELETVKDERDAGDVALFDAATAHGKTKVKLNKEEKLAAQRACEISNLQSVIDLLEAEKAELLARAEAAEAKLAGGEATPVAWVRVKVLSDLTDSTTGFEGIQTMLSPEKSKYCTVPLYTHPAPTHEDGSGETGNPDDIRAQGWAVAVHNDYRLNGATYTFWLFTRGDRAVKGEGRTDAEALNAVRSALSHTSGEVTEADLQRAYLMGRQQWCPAGILSDTARTERDWQRARAALRGDAS